MGVTRNTNTVVVVKYDRKDPLKSLNVDENMILNRILKKADRLLPEDASSAHVLAAGFCECG
jgi:hypothetical protein